MTSIQWADAAVQASILQSVGTVIASVIAAVCAAIIGAQISGKKRLERKLSETVSDIQFLLAVEEEHCKIHQAEKGHTLKKTVRTAASDRGLFWSGKYTPGRAKQFLNQ